jgi:hypothetical protein
MQTRLQRDCFDYNVAVVRHDCKEPSAGGKVVAGKPACDAQSAADRRCQVGDARRSGGIESNDRVRGGTYPPFHVLRRHRETRRMATITAPAGHPALERKCFRRMHL